MITIFKKQILELKNLITFQIIAITKKNKLLVILYLIKKK